MTIIKVEIDVFPDPEYCGDYESHCPHISDEWCECIYFGTLKECMRKGKDDDYITKKTDICKTAYQTAINQDEGSA